MSNSESGLHILKFQVMYLHTLAFIYYVKKSRVAVGWNSKSQITKARVFHKEGNQNEDNKSITISQC